MAEAMMVIKIGTESGEVRITNEGGELETYKPGVTLEAIKGVMDPPQLTLIHSKSSPGCIWVYNSATRTWTRV